MSYEPFSHEEFKEAVEDIVPRPTNLFEKLQYLENLLTCLHKLELMYGAEYRSLLKMAEKMPSDTYQLVPKQKSQSLVDVYKVRELLPEIYASTVKIKATDVSKIFTESEIYGLCRDKLGDEEIMKYAYIPKTKLSNYLSNSEAEMYYKTVVKEDGWTVKEK